jgi:hypothetical protein
MKLVTGPRKIQSLVYVCFLHSEDANVGDSATWQELHDQAQIEFLKIISSLDSDRILKINKFRRFPEMNGNAPQFLLFT